MHSPICMHPPQGSNSACISLSACIQRTGRSVHCVWYRCVLLDGCSEDVKKAAKAVLEPIAEASKAKGDDLVFFYAPTAEGPVEQVRKLTKLESSTGKPQMLLLDIPDSGGYYVSPADTVTADTVDGFIAAYKAKGLERKQLG